jgi:hypothetical protein
MRNREWSPLNTRRESRPTTGQLIAYLHAVWRVDKVENTPLSDADRELWLKHNMPDLDTWHHRPYRITVEWVGGAEPPWAEQDDSRRRGTLTIPAGRGWHDWHVYPSGRWPQCSCCGEPVPCRAELEDKQVSASLDRIARLEAIPPGACWACTEPITKRQKAVTYPGENLDLPGGQQVTFHTRRECSGRACRYEERWVAADPRRERILTWPRCEGILIVHGDGTSECVSGRAPLGGTDCESQPDCRGHLTHDHGVIRACYVDEDALRPMGRKRRDCPRGCDPSTHGGTRTVRRPDRRQPSTDGLFR